MSASMPPPRAAPYREGWRRLQGRAKPNSRQWDFIWKLNLCCTGAATGVPSR